ncbi:M20/M25/M40 family metallo-hydrolase [candidate division KSB1 bacterium]
MTFRNVITGIVCLILITPVFISAQIPQKIQTAYESIKMNDLEAQLSVIAADYTRGRETASEGFDIAAEYVVSLFKLWGIKPGGDNIELFELLKAKRLDEYLDRNSYYQEVPFVRVIGKPESYMIIKTESKDCEKEHIFQNETDFKFNSSESINLTADLVFAGYGKNDRDFNELKNINVKNKIVIVLDGTPGQSDPGSVLFKKYVEKRREEREEIEKKFNAGEYNLSFEEDLFKKRGALGVIHIRNLKNGQLDDPVSRGWNVNKPFRNDKYSIMYSLYEGDTPPERRQKWTAKGIRDTDDDSYFNINISRKAANVLFENNGFTLDELQKKIDKTGKPASFTLKDKKITIKNFVKTEIVNGKNVVGYIEGSDPVLKDEIIVLGAHLDHIGDYNNTIFNGADDNGSGSAGILELAQAFSLLKEKPKRSLVFCLWCGEEHGLWGSRYFTEHPFKPLKNIVMNLNFDMIGRKSRGGDPNPNKVNITSSFQSPEIRKIAEKYNELIGLDADFMEKGMYPIESDHSSFAEKDIAYLYFDTGLHEDYHQITDHTDKINFTEMEKIVRLAFLTVNEIADNPERPVYDKSIKPSKENSGMKLIFLEPEEKTPDKKEENIEKPAVKNMQIQRPGLNKIDKSKDTKIYYKITVDLPGRTKESYCRGSYLVKCGDKIIKRGTITLNDLSSEEGRTFKEEIEITGIDLTDKELMWNFRGEIYDSKLNEKFGPMRMEGMKFDKNIDGIGFNFKISESGKFSMDKAVYLKK